MKNNFLSFNADFIGFSASLLCAIHCAALPFAFALAPLAGLRFLQDPRIEYAIIMISLLIASYALIHGYRRHHQKPLALLVVLVGFTLIGIGHLLQTELQELILTSSGATIVAIAHVINWKHIRQSC